RADHERHRGNLPLAQEQAEQALKVLEDDGDGLDIAYAQLALALGEMRTSDYASAYARFERVLDVALREGDLYLQGAAHNGLAMITSYTSDDVDRAEEHYRASLRAHRRLGNAEG